MTNRNSEIELLKEMQHKSRLAESNRVTAAISHIEYTEASDAYYEARNKTIHAANGIPYVAPTASRLQEIHEMRLHIKGIGAC
jgi:hypothetical protein